MRVGFTEWSTRASTKERPFIDMFHVMAPTSSTDDGATHFSVVFRRNSGWQHSEETQVDTASLPPLYMHCCRCICTLLLSLLLPHYIRTAAATAINIHDMISKYYTTLESRYDQQVLSGKYA